MRLSITACILFLGSFSPLFTLPLEQTYCERVANGLSWHRANSNYTHLTDERIQEIMPIVREISHLEKKYHDDYYQVIVGQNSIFLAYQILLKELYKITRKQDFSDFEFFRQLDDPSLASNLELFFKDRPYLLQMEEYWNDIKDLSDEKAYEKMAAMPLDNTPTIASQLISCSFTLETFAPMNSALDVFAWGRGMAGDDWVPDQIPMLVAKAAKQEGIYDPELMLKLKKLIARAPLSHEGILMQIFIPKNQVQNVMYISWGGGFLNKVSDNIPKYYRDMEQLRESDSFNARKPDQGRVLAGALRPGNVIIKRHTVVDLQEIRTYESLVHDFWKDAAKARDN